MRKKPLAVFALAIISSMLLGVFAGTYIGAASGSVAQLNADQKQIYDNTVHSAIQAAQTIQYPASVSGVSDQAFIASKLTFFLNFFYSVSGHGTEVNTTLQAQGFTPDCITQCVHGINYFKDPTTLITSQGRGVEQCLVFGATITDTCTASNFAKQLGWSVDTHTPAAGDTWAGGATIPCSSNNVIDDANGLEDAAGTVTGGANGATVTTTVAKTFSITGTYTAVQAACILSADSGGTNPLIYAESTFGPDSFVSGDSLTGTWTVART